MEKSKSLADSNYFDASRVTTDAIQRRFDKNKSNIQNSNAKLRENVDDVDDCYCDQCKQNISALKGTKELKLHFDNVEHSQYSSCVYCSKPVINSESEKKKQSHSCVLL